MKAPAKKASAKRAPGKKVARKRAGTGRPSRYREEYAEQAFKLCLLGATDNDLANFFEVSERTVNAWKAAHPEFLQSIKRGKVQADAEVASRLYQRAIGYEVETVKVFQFQGKPVIVPLREKHAPDTAAGIFWLKNRDKARWRDKVDHEHGGADGGPINLTVTFRD